MKSGETLLGISGGEPSETDDITGHDREGPVGVRDAPRRRRPGTFLAPLVRSRWAPVAVLVVFGALLSVAVWPGHMDADALKQIQQARTGHFNNWWAPIIDWMMRGLFLLGGGPGIVVAATILTVLLSLYELLRARLSRWYAALASILVAVSPPVLGYLTALQRDVWFGASTLLSYALLVKAVKSSPRARLICAGLSLVADWFAMAARQNAIPALIPAVVIALLLLLRRPVAAVEPAAPRRRRPGRRPLLIALLTVVVFGAFYVSQDVLTYDVIGAAACLSPAGAVRAGSGRHLLAGRRGPAPPGHLPCSQPLGPPQVLQAGHGHPARGGERPSPHHVHERRRLPPAGEGVGARAGAPPGRLLPCPLEPVDG